MNIPTKVKIFWSLFLVLWGFVLLDAVAFHNPGVNCARLRISIIYSLAGGGQKLSCDLVFFFTYGCAFELQKFLVEACLLFACQLKLY